MRARGTIRLTLGLLVLGTAASVACARAGWLPASLTSASTPRPDSTGTTTRTTDNAGWVDNAGHTSEEYGRSEMSGMRATEVGAERFTGTPGSGLPIPIGPGIGPPPPKEQAALPLEGPPLVNVGIRIARALCDREIACGRVGAGKVWPTEANCMTRNRERVRDELQATSCAVGTDENQVATCLASARQLRCDASATDPAQLPECRAGALCMP